MRGEEGFSVCKEFNVGFKFFGSFKGGYGFEWRLMMDGIGGEDGL